MVAKIDGGCKQAILVSSPQDMAKVLFDASACSAAAYALAAHEIACEAADEQRMAFWHAVCCDLATLRETVDRAA